MTLVSLVCFGLAIVLAVWIFMVWRGFTQEWLPVELVGAKVFLVEKNLRTEAPYPIVGRPDQVYRLANRALVPLENKNRDAHRVYADDVAQLSLQGWVLRRNGYTTAGFGYVVINSRTTGERKAIRVQLKDDAFCEQLIRRYLDVTERRAPPRKSIGPKCGSCGHLRRCQ